MLPGGVGHHAAKETFGLDLGVVAKWWTSHVPTEDPGKRGLIVHDEVDALGHAQRGGERDDTTEAMTEEDDAITHCLVLDERAQIVHVVFEVDGREGP